MITKHLLAGAHIALLLACSSLHAQSPDALAFVADLHNQYRIVANQTYSSIGKYDCKLDLYLPRNPAKPVPTVIMIHGGGWVTGTKEITQMHIAPYLAMGFAVVNVGYRLGTVAPAPAAVEDVRAALRWVGRNAKQYMLDTASLIATGHSAGGHLALMAGMLPDGNEFDRATDTNTTTNATLLPHVSAIINWFGITDVADQIEGGKNKRDYAVQWFGAKQNATQNAERNNDLARRISPLTYVRKGLPPILTIHGNADPTVPYQHGVRLHEALTKAGAISSLHTIPGGEHGGFTSAETLKAYIVIQQFLRQHNLLKKQ
jgi:acetyl esterase/lipase